MTTVDAPLEKLKVKVKKWRINISCEPALRLSTYIAVENMITCIQSLTTAILTDKGLLLIG